MSGQKELIEDAQTEATKPKKNHSKDRTDENYGNVANATKIKEREFALNLMTELQPKHYLHELYMYKKEKGIWEKLGGYVIYNLIGEKLSRVNQELATHKNIKPIESQFTAAAFSPEYEIKECDPLYINLENGLLNITTLKLIPHTNKVFSITRIPVTYNPKAKAPEFAKHLNNILDDESKQIIQAYYGYCLLARVDDQKALWLYGVSNSGKSIFAKVLTLLLGEKNCTASNIYDLVEGFALGDIIGKRLCWVDEASSGERWDPKVETRLKAILSNALMPIKKKYKDGFAAPLNCKFILTSNQLPEVNDKTDGVIRRFIFIAFYNELVKIDTQFGEYLQENELAGILNWALAGVEIYLEKGLNDTTVSKEIKNEMRENSNQLHLFFSQPFNFIENKQPTIVKFTFGSGKTNLNNLYEVYKRYCLDEGNQLMSKKGFSKSLRNMFLKYQIKSISINGARYLENITMHMEFLN